nr:MAG TPA: hypothetical protein [Caudoviricetes sp.]
MAFVLQSLSLPWVVFLFFLREIEVWVLDETFLIFRELGVLTRRVSGIV